MLADNRAAIGLMRKLSPAAEMHFAEGEFEATMSTCRP
jgi:hypothetical protein